MKKLLAILVLGLLWWNTSFANNLDNRLLGQTWTEITLECLTYDELEKKLKEVRTLHYLKLRKRLWIIRKNQSNKYKMQSINMQIFSFKL